MSAPRKSTSTLGGKFNSIGTREEAEGNTALVRRLSASITPAQFTKLEAGDRVFLEDVRYKLRVGSGSKAQFGWRQVEAMVALHRRLNLGKEVRNGKGTV